MKLYSTAVAMFLLVSSAVVFAANGSGPGAGNVGNVGNVGTVPGEPAAKPMGEKMFGQPDIAADGIQNATQVDNPSDIGNKSSTASDSPEPLPTEGDVGIQNTQ